jgi:hypothetical protein
MFAIQVEAAIGGTKSLARLDDYSRDVWKAWAAGMVGDDDAQRLASLIEGRKAETRSLDTVRNRMPGVPLRLGASFFPPKRRAQVSPDRAASMERRRRLAFSGPLPPALACTFTTGQLAALRIVADAVRAEGRCDLSLAEIAARAGVSVCTARNAIREASRDGLLTIEERRRHGRRNLPNVVRIISREWQAWVARGRRSEGGGSKKLEPTDIGIRKPSVYAEGTAASRGDKQQPKGFPMKRGRLRPR